MIILLDWLYSKERRVFIVDLLPDRKRQETLPNFVNKNIDDLNNWNSTRNLTIHQNYKESNICINNEIIEQNIKGGTLLSTVSSLTVTVCKNIIIENPPLTETEDLIDDNIEEMLE